MSLKKTVSLMLLSTLVLFAKEVDVNRLQNWNRISAVGKVGTKGFGYFSLLDMRYNLGISKEVNGSEVASETSDFWRADLIAGGSWGKKLSEKVAFSTKLLYRPWLQNVDETAGERFLRHSIENRYELTHNIAPKLKLNYRLINWLQFADSTVANYDTEFTIRTMAGVKVPLNKKISLVLEEELFWKLTVEDTDIDGKELLHKNMLWSGAAFRLKPSMLLKLQYVHSLTRMADTELLTQNVTDHYLSLHLHLMPGRKK